MGWAKGGIKDRLRTRRIILTRLNKEKNIEVKEKQKLEQMKIEVKKKNQEQIAIAQKLKLEKVEKTPFLEIEPRVISFIPDSVIIPRKKVGVKRSDSVVEPNQKETSKGVFQEAKLVSYTPKKVVELSKRVKKELDQLKEEYQKYDRFKEEYDTDKVKQQQEELKALFERLCKLREDYLLLRECYRYDIFEALKERLEVDLIAETDQSLEDITHQCFLEIEALEGVMAFYEKQDREQIVNLRHEEEMKKKDQEYECSKEEMQALKEMDHKLEQELAEQERLLSRMNLRVDDIDMHEVSHYHVKNLDQIANQTLTSATALFAMQTGSLFGILFGGLLLNRSMRKMRFHIDFEETKELIYHCEDFSSILQSRKKTLLSLSYLLNNTVGEISKLKQSFINRFGSWIDQCPEYQSFLTRLNTIEKQVKQKQKELAEQQKMLKKQVVQNEKKLRYVKDRHGKID